MTNLTTATNTILKKFHTIIELVAVLVVLFTVWAETKTFQNDIFFNENKLF